MYENSALEKISAGMERIETELDFAEKLLDISPDAVCRKELEAAKKFFAGNAGAVNADSIEGFVSGCENLLKKTAGHAKNIVVHCVGHAHIDMNWQWPFDETVALVEDTFGTVLKLMERYEDFTFSQSQASVYRLMEEFNPSLLQKIKRKVKEGRWEVSSCTWVEADKNLSSGESQVRQILYTKKYFKKLFNLDYGDITLDFEPDTFGHAATVPMVLSLAGVKYYYHCRGFKGPRVSSWQAPDGSRITVYFEKEGWYIKTGKEVYPGEIGKYALSSLKNTGLKDVLFVFGVGDHGGGPTVMDIESIKKSMLYPVFPSVRFSTYADFFRAIEPFAKNFPVVSGERNFAFTGCYTSQSEIKRANRLGEKNLFEAESFAAIADRISDGFDYPVLKLENAWRKLLFNQFHDILPGSGRRETREHAMAQFQEIIAATSSTKKAAMSAIAQRIDSESVLTKTGLSTTRKRSRALGAGTGFEHTVRCISFSGLEDDAYRIFAVFNPSAFPRTETVEATLWDMEGKGKIKVKDCNGRDAECQAIETDGSYWANMYKFKKVLFDAADIPAFGYKTYVIFEDKTEPADTLLHVLDEIAQRTEAPFNMFLENEFYKIRLDESSGAITSLFLKEPGIDIVDPDKPFGLFRIIDEDPYLKGMSAWLIGPYAGIEPIKGIKVDFDAVRMGRMRQEIVWKAKVRSSAITASIKLEKGSRTIIINVKCDWQEKGSKESYVPQLNVVFPVPLKDSKRTFEIPFGSLSRENEGMDLPALRWVDISGRLNKMDSEAGCTVMTDSKYGFRTGRDFVSVSLLRSSFDPDPYPETGEHSFSIGVTPHSGRRDLSDSFRTAISFDRPLIVFQASGQKGDLPPEKSFLKIKNENVILSCFKKSEDGKGFILRVYEAEGKDTAAEIKIDKEFSGKTLHWSSVDLLERHTGKENQTKDGFIRFTIKAHSIASIFLRPAS